MPNDKHIYWTHKDFEIKTVENFLFQFGTSVAKELGIKEFLSYTGDTDTNNMDRIFKEYDDKEELEFKDLKNEFDLQLAAPSPTGLAPVVEDEESNFGTFLLKINTQLVLPKDKINREILAIAGKNQVVEQTSFNTFLAEQHKNLLKDPEYLQIHKFGNVALGVTKEFTPDISIWLWIRSQGEEVKEELQGEILDITPFIQSVTINQTKTGGNFTLRLVPITGSIDNLTYLRSVPTGYVSDNLLHKIISTNIRGRSHTAAEATQLGRSNFVWHDIIGTNDLIFIRFERLANEKNRLKRENLFKVSKEELPGNIYDMIGLVDNNTIVTAAEGSDVSIEIGGRDLTKVIIEDGAYFYPLQFADNMFLNIQDNDKLIKRTVTTGVYDLLALRSYLSVRRALQFIINQLAHMGVVPDSLFEAYKDRRVKVFRLDNETGDEDFKRERKESQAKLNDFKEGIKAQIEKHREEANISNAFNKREIDKAFNLLERFIRIAEIREKLQTTPLNDVIGWEGHSAVNRFVFGGEEVQPNQLPISFRNLLTPDCLVTFPFRKELALLNKAKQKQIDNDIVILEGLPELEAAPIDESRTSLEGDLRILVDELNFIEDSLQRGKELALRLEQLEDLEIVPTVAGATDFAGRTEFIPEELEAAKRGKFSFTTEEEIEAEKRADLDARIKELRKKKDESKLICSIAFAKDYERVLSDMNKYIIQRESQSKFEPPFTEELTNGIWQIINLVIDENITDRRMRDSSASQPDGSLINQFNKICQEPFVEFFTDTYGDQFFFMVRQQPFTGEAIREFINDGLVIDIEEEDIYADTLSFNENDLYSWYEIRPQGAFLGKADTTVLSFIPAVYFPEYADVWGSRRLTTYTNYISYNGLVGNQGKEDRRFFIEQIIQDLKYLIDIHAYMPFTRSGSITMLGDRRIKRGTFVRLKSTNEIFYVEAVANNYSQSMESIERITTLQVSRGMKEKYIFGVSLPEFGDKEVSYFNIINTQFIKDTIIEKLESGQTEEGVIIKQNFGVNKEIFNFFLKRRQLTE